MLAAAGDEAAEVTVGGKRAWVLARDLPGMLSATTQGIARLLPAFDPWVIAPRGTHRCSIRRTWHACTGRRGGSRRCCW